jgi:replicative DNA helicase
LPVASPPHSDDAEKGCLGSGLIDPACISEIVQKALPEWFYAPANQTIYREMVNLWQSQEKFDLLTLTQHLRDRGMLDKIGGPSYVTSLFTFVPTASNVGYYLDILRGKYILREVAAASMEAHRMAYEEQEDAEQVLSDVQSRFNSIADSGAKDAATIKELVQQSIEEIELAYEKKSVPGLHTGLIDLDRKLGGMKPKQLIIIAGETGQGKTALSLNIIEHNAIRDNIPCGIVSLEMSGQELTQRMIASEGRVDMHRLITAGGHHGDFPKMTAAATKIMNSPIFIRDDSDVDSVKLRGIGRQMKHDHKIQLLVVDYIQLMTPQNTKDENRERAIATAAHALKQMAKELGIVVIALSQLNDSGKLRESRAIGHHADSVLTISHGEEFNDPSTIHINKNRTGPTGAVSCTFLRFCARFESIAQQKES